MTPLAQTGATRAETPLPPDLAPRLRAELARLGSRLHDPAALADVPPALLGAIAEAVVVRRGAIMREVVRGLPVHEAHPRLLVERRRRLEVAEARTAELVERWLRGWREGGSPRVRAEEVQGDLTADLPDLGALERARRRDLAVHGLALLERLEGEARAGAEGRLATARETVALAAGRRATLAERLERARHEGRWRVRRLLGAEARGEGAERLPCDVDPAALRAAWEGADGHVAAFVGRTVAAMGARGRVTGVHFDLRDDDTSTAGVFDDVTGEIQLREWIEADLARFAAGGRDERAVSAAALLVHEILHALSPEAVLDSLTLSPDDTARRTAVEEGLVEWQTRRLVAAALWPGRDARTVPALDGRWAAYHDEAWRIQRLADAHGTAALAPVWAAADPVVRQRRLAALERRR